MANASLIISLQTPLALATLQRYVKDTTDARGECRAVSHLFKRIEEGLTSASFDVGVSANAPVRATNTLTLTYASISNNDTVVICGVTLTCVTGTPGAHQFKKLTNATVTAGNLVALINSDATVSCYCKATNVAGVVTLTLNTPGLVGNFAPLVGSTGMVVGAATFATGAGGYESQPVSYVRG